MEQQRLWPGDVLYEDKFCRLKKNQLKIKQYYFPCGTAKRIGFDQGEIIAVYFEQQSNSLSKNFGHVKGWGMALTPVWWACDLSRGLFNKQNRANVVIDTGTAVKKGFTVVDIGDFLHHLRPLLQPDTVVQSRIPY